MRSFRSIAPKGREQAVYLVLDDFGRLGRAFVRPMKPVAAATACRGSARVG
jgi:hypothetical protein